MPHVLDALLRTILSAATTNTNSARAFQGVIDRFELVDEDGKAVKGPTTDDKKLLPEAIKTESEPVVSQVLAKQEGNEADNGSNDVAQSVLPEKQVKPEKFAEDDINEQLFIKAGLGTVNWNAVRLAPAAELREAIWRGGLADSKSKNIKTILDMVFEQNMPKRDGEPTKDNGKDQITLDFLASLDYLRSVEDNEQVREKLQSFPGVGLKTAMCA